MFELLPWEHRPTKDLARYWNDFERNFFAGTDGIFALPKMKTDISDRGEFYLLRAELPGFEKDEIKIAVEGDTLTIKAEHKGETEEKKENYLHRECHYGSYTRRFNISEVVGEKVRANYKNGVLELEMPKRFPTQNAPRTIEVE